MRDGDMKDFGRSMKGWSPHCPLWGEVDINDRLSISLVAIGPFGHMAPPFVVMRASEPCYIGPDHWTVGKRMRRCEFIALLSGEAAGFAARGGARLSTQLKF